MIGCAPLHDGSGALEAWQRAGNLQRAAWSTQNLGEAYRAMGCFDKAIHYVQNSVELLGQLHDRSNQAIARMSLGIVHVMQDNPSAAEELFQQAEQFFREAGDQRHLAMVQNNLAVALRMQGKAVQALAHGLGAVRLWKHLGDARSLANSLDEVGVTYQAIGDHGRALAAFQEGVALLKQIPPGRAYDTLEKTLASHIEETLASTNTRGK